MLGEKPTKKASPKKTFALIGIGVVLSLPAIFLSVSGSTGKTSDASFGDALWNLRGMDVILQALVVLTVALGIAIVLYEKKERWAIMDFVILSLVMLAIGIYGLLTNRQLLKVFISVELIATAATLNFVMLASSTGQGLGQAFLILAFSTDTAVSAVILALLVIVSKKYGTSNLSEIIKMQEKAES